MKIGQKFKRVSQSLFFNKVAEHLRTTASVIPPFQYTLFISLSIFYFSLEYLWSMDFQSESCLVLAYSIHFQPQVSR